MLFHLFRKLYHGILDLYFYHSFFLIRYHQKFMSLVYFLCPLILSDTSDDHDKSASRESREGSPEAFTPPDTLGQSINIEEIQKKLTDSFSRKMEEWEKQKYKPREGSPGLVRKDSGGKSIVRKEERQKSRKMKDGKGKLERQRERELQRVEKEQQKLEKEKMRLEKERLKALEREARIEKMKGRLSQSDMDTKFKNPVLSPLAEYKVTSDFAKKLHQWELRKGSGSVSMATYLETQQKSLGQSPSPDSSTKKETFTVEEEPQAPTRKLSRGQKPPPLTLMPCSDSPDEVSPGARSRSSLDSFEDETSITTESMTESNISRYFLFFLSETIKALLMPVVPQWYSKSTRV